jgi:glucose-1-phosphate cytidylyltransferase
MASRGRFKVIAVILAGGKGTRLSEETQFKPKPLVEAGGYPLIWHIIQNYSLHGINEFIVLAGYRGEQIKSYFSNYWMNAKGITFDIQNNKYEVIKRHEDNWRVTILDTGSETETGGRLLKAKDFLGDQFLLAYGDGVADVDITNLIKFHNNHDLPATLTAVKPQARFGALRLNSDKVESFQEKPEGEGGWVNGGFFVLKQEVFDYFDGDNESFEFNVLPRIAESGNLRAYRHPGYWQPVDTLRDLHNLNEAITLGKLPWLAGK